MQLTFEHNASPVGANSNYSDSVLAELTLKCAKEHYLWYIYLSFIPKRQETMIFEHILVQNVLNFARRLLVEMQKDSIDIDKLIKIEVL
jgi:hypothetical protein